jgi:hypothetical protein
MPGIRPVLEQGPLTFDANVNIMGGSLVMPDGTTGRIKPTVADTPLCLGVATGDASAYSNTNADTTDAWGNPIVNAQVPPVEVAVAWRGVWRLTASGAIAFGALVVAGANGVVVTRAAQGLDSVIGKCVEPGGIASGQRGKILLGGVGAA